MEVFKKHVSGFETATAVVFWIMLLLTVITQVFFDGHVLLLMAICAVLAVTFSLLVFFPEVYELGDEALSIVKPKPAKSVQIPYDQVLKIDTVGLFRHLKRDFDSVEVILTFRPSGGKRKRTISCHPKNVLAFVKALQEKCPNLEQGEKE